MRDFIKRDVYFQLISTLSGKEITLIIGPQQAGKTTLLLRLKDFLEKKQKKCFILI